MAELSFKSVCLRETKLQTITKKLANLLRFNLTSTNSSHLLIDVPNEQ